MEVGQEAAIISGHGSSVHFGWIVKRITPTGRFVLAKPGFDGKEMVRQFNAEGLEIGNGSSRFYRARAVFDIEARKADAARRQRQIAAAVAVESVKVDRCLPTYNKEVMQGQIAELEQKLAAARAAVEAI